MISCSNETNYQDERSSNLIKPNFTSIQIRYDCKLNKDKSLNNLEALIPSLVTQIQAASPSANLEFLFNQANNIERFSILYSDNEMNADGESFTSLVIDQGISKISSCNSTDEKMLSANIYIDKISGDDRRTNERLRRGKLRIEARIDKHGYYQDVAQSELNSFISSCALSGRRVVLVITGKGSLSKGGGVLRKNLPDWLNQPSCRPYILAFCAARPEHGGGGAFYILLRRSNN